MPNAVPIGMLSRRTKKTTARFLKKTARALPRVRYINERRSSPILPILLGAIGAAAFGSIAAVMLFSPRTRRRALDAAKETYDKVADRIEAAGIADKLGLHHEARIANGLASDVGSEYGPNAF